MECNCKVTNTVLGLVALVFTVWPVAASKWIVSIAAAKWIVSIAAALVVIHAWMCRSCESCESEEKPAAKPSVKAKKAK